MEEKWFRWHPLEDVHTKYSMNVLIDTKSNLTIELSPCELFDEARNKRHVTILFTDPIFSYQVADEGNRLKTLRYLSEHYEKDFYGKWTFFTVKDSAYIQWMLEESPELRDMPHLIQYTLMCDNPIVDILSIHEPIISYQE